MKGCFAPLQKRPKTVQRLTCLNSWSSKIGENKNYRVLRCVSSEKKRKSIMNHTTSLVITPDCMPKLYGTTRGRAVLFEALPPT